MTITCLSCSHATIDNGSHKNSSHKCKVFGTVVSAGSVTCEAFKGRNTPKPKVIDQRQPTLLPAELL